MDRLRFNTLTKARKRSIGAIPIYALFTLASGIALYFMAGTATVIVFTITVLVLVGDVINILYTTRQLSRMNRE